MFNYPLRQKRPATRVKNTEYEMREERRKPIIPGPYVYVGDFDADDPPVVTWQSPVWENGWSWFGTAYVGFRHGLDGETEFIGTLDTSGATTGTVAFTLPVPWRPLTAYSFLTDLDLGAGAFSASRVVVATTGTVTVYFPINP